MAEYDAGDNRKQFPPVFHRFSVNGGVFFSFFVFYQDFAAASRYGSGKVFFSVLGDFAVMHPAKGRSIGAEIKCLKKIGFSLTVFPDKENIASVS